MKRSNGIAQGDQLAAIEQRDRIITMRW